jgi:hypothetical protein
MTKAVPTWEEAKSERIKVEEMYFMLSADFGVDRKETVKDKAECQK